ncbi:MAG TPA: SpoIID/LytB domain-containing protein, partial [Anaeromyxobacteraceae bacterium]|nr:SpoIID/LytB domain-containing protein [Anaeromyxobacteraceae bacterium]
MPPRRHRALAVATLALLSLATRTGAEEMIRVAVRTGASRTTLSAPGLRVRPAAQIVEGQAEALHEGDRVGRGKVEVRVDRRGDGLSIDGKRWAAPVAVFAADGAIRADGRELSRWVEVRRARSGLAVVEVLPMEDYVAGVVSGETPATFPPEARRAQAVAARTFALVRKL